MAPASNPKSSSAQRAAKRGRLRVTTGCLTCRQRRIKCDEGKPSCVNCGKKDRTCRYEGTVGVRAVEKVAEETTVLDQSPPQSFVAVCSASTSNQRQRTSLPAPKQRNNLAETQPESSPAVCSYNNQVDQDNVLSAFNNPQEENILSPFSATLGSILLDAEHYPFDANNGVDEGSVLLHHLHTSSTSALGQHPDQLGELHAPPPTLRVDYQIQLSVFEVPIFRNYVDNISHWVDSFSHDKPFHRLVPILALRCAPLLHSCLALASKQMDLVGVPVLFTVPGSESMRYYRLALSAIRTLLLHPEFAQSDEVLASCILLSSYEMIDVVGESLGSHLTGVASLLQARQVYGNVAGIRGTCYWTWYRHEVWAALRTGRQMSLDSTYWEPEAVTSFEELSPEDIANRVIFIFGQCINFCNDDDTATTAVSNASSEQSRAARAASLDQALDDWKSKLPSSMAFVPVEKRDESPILSHNLDAIWFIFPHSAVANQVYHASKIMLGLNRRQEASPVARGLTSSYFLVTQRRIESHRRQIFLTANAGIPDAWSLVSTQCLYIAGLVTEGVQERQKTLDLIDQCQRNSGRKTGVLSTDLRHHWALSMESF